jgi:uncharacterized membrane protein
MPAVIASIWQRRYWLFPLALAVLLIVFLIQRSWLDSIILGAFLTGFLGFLAVVRGYEGRVFEKITQGEPKDGE